MLVVVGTCRRFQTLTRRLHSVTPAQSRGPRAAHAQQFVQAQAVRAAGRAAARAAAALAAAARAAAARAAERAAARAAINSSPVDLPKQLQLPAIADAGRSGMAKMG